MRPSVRTGQTELAAVRAKRDLATLSTPAPPTFPVLGKTPVNLLAVQTTQSLIISAQLKLGDVLPPERELAALAELSIESRKPTARARPQDGGVTRTIWLSSPGSAIETPTPRVPLCMTT